MRPKIAEQGVVYATQAGCPGFLTGGVIYTDGQDLCIENCELRQFCFVGRDLAGTNGGKGEWEKGKDDVHPFKLA